MKPRSADLSRRTGRRHYPAFVPLVLAVAGLPLACPTATLAGSASAPDSARIASLRFALRNFEDVRVDTDDAKLLTRHPVASAEGLRLRSSPKGWRITSETPAQEQLVSWAEIESIHVRRGASGAGLLLGAVAGLTIGGIMVSSSENGDDARLWTVGFVVGTSLGALIDHPWPGSWQSVYP